MTDRQSTSPRLIRFMSHMNNRHADLREKRPFVNREGFTLVELLIVVVVLVVLAAIAVPIFLNQAGKARDASAIASVSAVASAIALAEGSGGTIGLNAAGTSLIATDASGGTVTVPRAGIVIKQGATSPGAAVTGTTQVPVAAYWCVSMPTSGGTAAHAIQTDSSGKAAASATACP